MMYVELRLYRRFDADLLSLWEQSIPVAKLAKDALAAYANGKRIRYLLPRAIPAQFGERKNVHLRLQIQDKASQALLRQIKRGYRCQFVKTVLRNTLLEQSIAPFFTDDQYIALEDMRIRALTDLSENGTFEGAEIALMQERKKEPRQILRPAGYKRNNQQAETKTADTHNVTEINPSPTVYADTSAATGDTAGNSTTNSLTEDALLDMFNNL